MKVFTTGQVAKICKVAPRTVSKWFDSGRLKGYRIPGSQPAYRIVLGCKHRRDVTRIQIDRERLSVGKTVECVECGRESRL